ncbi:MAG: hypothetical protein KJO28_15335, partial [Desulfofustis sp.]|nr:hypothetical protein [Desulfofustis sp.]
KIIQRRFGYSDEELQTFLNDPRNMELVSRRKEFERTRFVLEVVKSKGCNSNHKVGDKFYFDFAGNILTELCPPRICGYSLNSAMMMIYTANEMLYAGVDPHEIRFKRASCFDVGIECGGWGRIVLELKIEKQ